MNEPNPKPDYITICLNLLTIILTFIAFILVLLSEASKSTN